MLRAGVFLLIVGVAAATVGFDATQALSEKTFECMAENGHQFFIARVFTAYGICDDTGVVNLRNARAAGLKQIHGYIFPCLSEKCPTPEQQVSITVNRLANEKTEVDMLWLDIEAYNWSPYYESNQKFIQRMGDELDKSKVNWGIYTSYYNWGSVVGHWNQYANKSLWWANHNGNEDFQGFIPFGGWTKPTIHQYASDVHGPCSVSLNRNWYESS